MLHKSISFLIFQRENIKKKIHVSAPLDAAKRFWRGKSWVIPKDAASDWGLARSSARLRRYTKLKLSKLNLKNAHTFPLPFLLHCRLLPQPPFLFSLSTDSKPLKTISNGFLLPLPSLNSQLSITFPCMPSPPPPLQFPKTLKPSHSPLHLAMKDRSPSSNGAVYVPPHLRLRSVVTSPNHSSALPALDCKLREAPASVLDSAAAAPPCLDARSQELLQSENSPFNSLQFDSAFDDGPPVESWDCNFEFSHQSVRFFSFAVFTCFFD